MAQTSGSSRFAEIGFYLVVLLVAVVAWKTQSFMATEAQRQFAAQTPSDGIYGQPLTQLDGVQEKQLDAYLEVNRLLTTFGTTLLGALGFLLFGQQKASDWTRHRWAAWLGVLLVAVSIFFGYVAYLFLLQTLRDQVQQRGFDLTSSSPHWAQQAHFYTFLAGVVFLADFVFHNMRGESERANLPQAAGS